MDEAAGAERRVCSVLFCDLVGFTPLSEARDPEEVRELLSRYFEAARTVVSRHGGVLEKFIGDAVMAVWGTPVAVEGDTERAVRAALELIDMVQQLGQQTGIPGLSARAGVVTGMVAVTLGATGQGMVAGDAVNTAARVQTAAEPGTVLVDEPTWRVAQAAIGFTSVGERLLKGKVDPLPLWRAEWVLSGVGGSQRIDGLEATFVGREAELRLVKDLFHATVERHSPRLVSVTGAAGVGKSRLGWEFEKYIDGLSSVVYWHRGRCLAYGEGVAFWALAEIVRQRLDIAEEDSTEVAATKLSQGLRQWVPDQESREYVAPRLAQLLGVDAGGPRTILARDELFAGWRVFFERLAAEAPVVLVIEDLQYADPGLLDFLEHLLDWARDAPIFVLTLARPDIADRRAGWAVGRRNSTAMSLDVLDDHAMELLLDDLVPAMPEAARTAIAARAEGIPLYAVETVRMLIDRDVVQPVEGVYRLTGDLGRLAVPDTLQSLLSSRLDALEPAARHLVGDAAVLGGSFPAEALVAISGRPEDEVRGLLDELVRREVLGVRADPLSPERGHYAFTQTMFRQVAYDTLSRRERKSRHLAVAAHLEVTFAEGGDEIAEVIASHLVDALNAVPDDPDVGALRHRAVAMLVRAGERAERTGAPATATATFSRAAELVAVDGSDVEALSAAGLWERAGKAAAAADPVLAVELFERAGSLYAANGCPRDAARANTGAAAALTRRGRHEQARAMLQEAIAVLESPPDADTVRAVGELAGLEIFAGRADGDRLAASALAQAQALDLADVSIAQLLLVRGLGHAFADRMIEAAAYLRESQRRAEAARDPAAISRALSNLADVLTTEDPRAAADAARSALAHGRRVGNRAAVAVAVINLIQALLLTGDWPDAEEVYAVAADDDGMRDDPNIVCGMMLLRAFREDRGGLAALTPVIQDWRGTEDPQDLSQAETALAASAACHRDHVRALDHAQHALARAEAIGFRSDAIRWAWTLAADAALNLGDTAEVSRLLDSLSGIPPGHLPPVLRAEVLRVRARLLAARGEDSGAAFDTAVEALRGLGSPYHLAVGLLDHAEQLTTKGDHGSAARLATEAATIASRLGASGLTARAAAVRGASGTVRTADSREEVVS
ncbi:MAG: hypothetical protein QOK15_3823 [Nocardioidaceae bacterium]|nr:hypothetical protein [Nocardioidaceae bacterium]